MLGLGLGPLVAGPMSEIYGRSAVYSVSFGFFFVFLFPVAFAPNISKCVWRVGAVAGSITLVRISTAVYLIFRFLAGCSGAAFLSIAGGSVSDMFSISEVATYVVRCYLGSLACLMILNSPMAVYTICPFLGPEIGPVLSG